IENILQKLAEKKKITVDEKEETLHRIRYTNDIQNCLADIFIEAIIEKEEIKITMFNQLAELNNNACIFATNTSSLSVTKIAESVKNPQRVIGMHFFNPAPVMKLVEIVKTKYTNERTEQIIYKLAEQMRKVPVIC